MISRATSSIPAWLPPSGGSSWIDTTQVPSRRSRASRVSSSTAAAATASSRSATWNGARGLRPSSTAERIAAISVGVVPQQPPTSAAPSWIASAVNSAKYSGVACGKMILPPASPARPRFGSAASGGPSAPIPSSAARHACGPAPWLAPSASDSELPEPQCRLPRRHARERLPVLVEGQQGDDRQRRDRADGVDRRLELAEVVERLDEEQVDAARREQFGLLGEERAPLLLRVAHVAERPDRPGDEHLLPGHLTGLAGDLDPLGVDALDVVVEEARRELEPVGAEGVRLDQLGTRADEAEVQ